MSGLSDRRALLLVALAWAVSVVLWLNPGITKPDGVGYYVYLPSISLDHDLLFFNEWDRFGLIDRGLILHKEITATGHLGNHWTIGSAIFWFPSFLFAPIVRLIPSLSQFPVDGISLPYNVAVGFSSAVAGLLTLGIGFHLARARVPAFPALLGTLGLWFGSPLLFYSVRNPIMSHAPSAFACALVVLLSVKLRVEKSGYGWLAAGLASGFAFIVRPQNGTFAVLPFLIAAGSARPLLQRIGLFAGGFVIGALPQAIVLRFVYGNPLGMLGGSSATKPFAAFERLWTWEPILSWYHGLIPWSPVIGLGIVGLLLLWKQDRRLATAGIYAFASQWLINATLERSFWGADAFGQRRFDNCTVFFLLGTAVLLAKWPRGLQLLVVGVTSLWTMSLFFAAMGSLDHSAYYTPAELLTMQWSGLNNVLAHLEPMSSVPPAMKSRVMILLLSFGGAWILVAFAGAALKKRGLASATLLISLYFLLMSGLLAISGITGRERVIHFESLIDFNRKASFALGSADFRTPLLADEAYYLRKAGRIERAEETERELAELEAARRASLQRLRAINPEQR